MDVLAAVQLQKAGYECLHREKGSVLLDQPPHTWYNTDMQNNKRPSITSYVILLHEKHHLQNTYLAEDYIYRIYMGVSLHDQAYKMHAIYSSTYVENNAIKSL